MILATGMLDNAFPHESANVLRIDGSVNMPSFFCFEMLFNLCITINRFSFLEMYPSLSRYLKILKSSSKERPEAKHLWVVVFPWRLKLFKSSAK